MPKAFKEVTPLDVEFKPLLTVEKALADEIQRLRRRQIFGIDVENEIRNCEEKLRRVREKIMRGAVEKIPKFIEIAGELGLDGNDVNGLSALAGLLIYLRWPCEVSSFHKAVRFLGLYRPTREEVKRFEERSGKKYRKHYSGYARRYICLLTAAILRRERNVFPPKAKDEKEVLRRLLKILKTINESIAVEGQDKSSDEACGEKLNAPMEEWSHI